MVVCPRFPAGMVTTELATAMPYVGGIQTVYVVLRAPSFTTVLAQ